MQVVRDARAEARQRWCDGRPHMKHDFGLASTVRCKTRARVVTAMLGQWAKEISFQMCISRGLEARGTHKAQGCATLRRLVLCLHPEVFEDWTEENRQQFCRVWYLPCKTRTVATLAELKDGHYQQLPADARGVPSTHGTALVMERRQRAQSAPYQRLQHP